MLTALILLVSAVIALVLLTLAVVWSRASGASRSTGY